MIVALGCHHIAAKGNCLTDLAKAGFAGEPATLRPQYDLFNGYQSIVYACLSTFLGSNQTLRKGDLGEPADEPNCPLQFPLPTVKPIVESCNKRECSAVYLSDSGTQRI